MLTTALRYSVAASKPARPIVRALDPVRGPLSTCVISRSYRHTQETEGAIGAAVSRPRPLRPWPSGDGREPRRLSFHLRGHGHWIRLASSSMNVLEVRIGVAQGVRMLSFGLA